MIIDVSVVMTSILVVLPAGMAGVLVMMIYLMLLLLMMR